MNRSDESSPQRRRLAIEVRGVVQGVGFRPFIYGLARQRGLSGWVRNEADVVRIEVEGDTDAVASFCEALRNSPPPQAGIESIEIIEAVCRHDSRPFEIGTSSGASSPKPTLPADLATCPECLIEIRTPGERRHGYPFTNCTNCGPRWSIVESLPYDRPRTSMAAFAMCEDCRREYEDPADRRFHAQPIACPRCGPSLQLLDNQGQEKAAGAAALDAAARTVLSGRILALKGLGGFQLIVDATDGEAVERLRRRKRRPDRPFALMMRSIAEIRGRCELSEEEQREIESPRAPILLLRRRRDKKAVGDLAESVAPGNPYLGVMLPCTPLHHLLMDAVKRPIVCTSGNLSEEPMAITTEDALERLGLIADLLLVHDRPIVRPVDDSVARLGGSGLQILRRARGYAPLPIDLGHDVPALLAVGGHLKNTVAVAIGSQVVVSPHIGDLDSVLSVDVHRRAIDDLLSFFQLPPAAIACDLHPDYASTREAERLAAAYGVRLERVQHHHAHVAACLAEHGLLDDSPEDAPVVGFSWDGTGYGPDGTIWGGEVLECTGGGFRRLAHLRTFPLPGGDRAVRQPRRSALGLLYEMLGDAAAEHAASWFEASELDALMHMLDRGVSCPRTSSMGRLFDALAAICGMPQEISFEGQAAMALEYAADWTIEDAYPLPLNSPCGSEASSRRVGQAQRRPTKTPVDSPWRAGAASAPPDQEALAATVIDWEPLVRSVLADRASGVPVEIISARVHNGLAHAAASIARHLGGRAAVLTGGCFQNALLAERARRHLSAEGVKVYTHSKVPPGDGGIALGQIFVAARRIKETSHVSGNPR